jgi:prolyl-tRNA editing enzyme YbaK/EbsC (Cys-tRNA(Pro) deacylase)
MRSSDTELLKGAFSRSCDVKSAEDIVISALKSLGVPYEIIEIDPEFADTAVFCEKYDWPPEKSANTIIVASKKEPKKFVACVVLATTRLDVNKRVRRLMEVPRASFATAEEMKQLTGMEVGGVTVFALPDGLPLYVDERVMACDWVILGGGGRSIKIKISPEIFTKLGAEVMPDLALELS